MCPASSVVSVSSDDDPTAHCEIPWPLSFRLQTPKPRKGSNKKHWWSYELYRGPEGQQPRVFYAGSRADSERIARKFLQQRVLGFDMKWVSWNPSSPSNERLQERVSLIQLASEDKIALFHLGVHPGDQPADLVAPSLRRMLESSLIIKAGSNIMGDFRRLREFLELRPQGAIEVSHLHNLVTYGDGDGGSEGQWRKCTTASCALAEQVGTHLGLPLKKGTVARSDWSRRDLTKPQRAYAASDAYAGFMLYHCLRSKLGAMTPRPHPPLYAERYTHFKTIRGLGSSTQLLLVVDTHSDGEEDHETITVITAQDFLRGHHDKTHTHTFERQDAPSLEVDAEAQEALVAYIAPRSRTTTTTTTAGRGGNPYQRAVKRWKKPPKASSSSLLSSSSPSAAAATATTTQSSSASERRRRIRRGSSENPLLQALRQHREKIARQRNLQLYAVASNDALQGIARQRPRTRAQLLEVKGVGRTLCDKWGDAWLNMVERQIQVEVEVEVDSGGPSGVGAERREMEGSTEVDSVPPVTTPSSAPLGAGVTGSSPARRRSSLLVAAVRAMDCIGSFRLRRRATLEVYGVRLRQDEDLIGTV
ncbi:ribonuclease H-like domain-containing protein [Xylariomycetidae sp. FL2044]|nr:ribonuclease H-like domain-containing protein [Xylariomycetidae sp. FL2044]